LNEPQPGFRRHRLEERERHAKMLVLGLRARFDISHG
jgi:hypothetical protein